MKKIIFLMAAAVLVATGCKDDDEQDQIIDVEKVTVSPTTLSLVAGDPASQLTVTVEPMEAEQEVSWVSSNPAVATVEDGLVTPLIEGFTIITATSVIDGTKTASCTVTVTPATIPVESISFDKTTMTLVNPGDKESLEVIWEPSDATTLDVAWTSSDPSIATVSETGVVTAVAIGGPVTITATVTTASGDKTATCEVTVTGVLVEGIAFDVTTMSLAPGGTQTLAITWTPAEPTNKKVAWTTSAAAVATVDENGVVTAVAVGTATITATTEDGGKTATCEVTVATVAVEGIAFNSTTLDLAPTETKTLTITWTPADAANKNVAWTTSDATVATVSEGVVTAVGTGTATITATTEDGGKTATCVVTVKEPATVLTMNVSSVTMGSGTKYNLIATSEPVGAVITWSTNNASAVTVDASTGVIQAVGAGTATITATPGVGEPVTCAVTVDGSLASGTIKAATDVDLSGLVNGAAEGNTILLAAGGEYTSGRATVLNSLTIRAESGVTRPKVTVSTTWRIQCSTENRIENILLEGVDFVGSGALYLFEGASGAIGNLGTISFKDCTFESFGRGVYFQQGANSVDAIIMEECIVKNNGTASSAYNVITANTNTDVKIGQVVLKNSTFNGLTTNIMGLQNYRGETPLTVLIEACTFYNTGGNNQYFRLENIPTLDVTVKDCLFAKDPKNTGAGSEGSWMRTLWISVDGTNPAAGVTRTVTNNHATSDFVERASGPQPPQYVDLTTYTKTADEVLTAQPNGVMKITDTSFPNVGDPRGRY